MANEPELVAKDDLVVAWSYGQALLQRGKPYDGPGHTLLMKERPDLFVPRVDDLPGVRPMLEQCWNWRCAAQFQPHSDMQRYCSTRCRRERENDLKKAARLVTRRDWPQIPKTSGPGAKQSCYEHLKVMDGLVALVGSLVTHLGGRLWIGVPPQVDEAELKVSNKAGLLALAKTAYVDIMEHRNKSAEAVGLASANNQLEGNAEGAMATYRAREAEAQHRQHQWDAELAETGDERINVY